MSKFLPMLAATAKVDKLDSGFLQSIKLEGVRGEFTPEGLLTRNLKPFKNELIYEEFELLEQYCMDIGVVVEGEFYVHGWTFNRIDSCLRGSGNTDVQGLHFHVFDIYREDSPEDDFEKRYALYKGFVQYIKQTYPTLSHRIHAVEQYPFVSEESALNAYKWAVEHGYEGICFKRKDLTYKLGRSTVKQGYFLRIKPEETYDSVIIKFLERQENLCESEVNELGQKFKRQNKDQKAGTGMAQNALVYTPSINKVHKVSMTRGLSDPERMRLWENKEAYVGKCVQWVGIPVPGQVVPRSPRFDKFREDIQPTFLEHSASDCILAEWDEALVTTAINNACDVVSVERFIQCYEAGFALGE